MADEKNLVDVYASIYNKKEDLNEGLGSVIANAGAGVVGTMIGNKLSGKGKEDKKEEERLYEIFQDLNEEGVGDNLPITLMINLLWV